MWYVCMFQNGRSGVLCAKRKRMDAVRMVDALQAKYGPPARFFVSENKPA